MKPLTLDDLLPLEEFASRRRELLEAHGRYLDRQRRVQIGPRVALVFENRQTLWFRVQEMLRIARLAEPERVQQELDLQNRLLPGRERLQAALLLEVQDEARLTDELAPWQTLQGEHLRLKIGERPYPANLLTCRPEDRCIGTAYWVQFVVDAVGRRRLADFSRKVCFEMTLPAYQHQSPPLSEDVRESLFDDLELSDRD